MTALGHLLFAALASLALPVLALDPVRLADWKSFIHGEPPPFVKAPPPKQLAVVSTAPGVTGDAQIESFMRALADAVMARDASAVLARLSERYSVDGAPDGTKPAEFMAQAIGKMPGPTQIIITSVQAQAGVRAATAQFHYGPEKMNMKTFRFDREGKLLESDLFRLARG